MGIHVLYRIVYNRKCGSNCILQYNRNEHSYTKLMHVVNIAVHGGIYRKTLYMCYVLSYSNFAVEQQYIYTHSQNPSVSFHIKTLSWLKIVGNDTLVTTNCVHNSVILISSQLQ